MGRVVVEGSEGGGGCGYMLMVVSDVRMRCVQRKGQG